MCSSDLSVAFGSSWTITLLAVRIAKVARLAGSTLPAYDVVLARALPSNLGTVVLSAASHVTVAFQSSSVEVSS